MRKKRVASPSAPFLRVLFLSVSTALASPATEISETSASHPKPDWAIFVTKSSFGDYVIARLSPERVDMCSFGTGDQESPHKLKSRLDVSPLSGEIAGFMRELQEELDTLRLSGWASPLAAPSGSGGEGMPIPVDGPSWEILLIEGDRPDFRVRDLRQYGEVGSLVNLIMDKTEEAGARLPLVPGAIIRGPMPPYGSTAQEMNVNMEDKVAWLSTASVFIPLDQIEGVDPSDPPAPASSTVFLSQDDLNFAVHKLYP